ncbi:drug resistance transporter, EmrB/QacA subfamily [Saccharopolyspora kobensis]|uniref:Drug resistance transporter, EmrB/QacA subfamily n=1 Tax=Saccharopolyspora kobensis TaxID=146035 RepID=A0A1H6DEE5_9PSEU|nr:MFS transporter [Saccharopolyspora kobensis]SEG83083.1 drug resistance transporter, EmrB/QacA subfamily [Saccharopolyspora kobensis]SFE28267.1 drug resistance transporter, EmrB/QacA subfamily [Saccharopolyspora kobensis]
MIRSAERSQLAPRAGRPAARQWFALGVALTGTFLATFDLFVVNIAVPSLRADLRAGDAAVELVVSGYAFAYAAGLVTGGRLGDRFGYRRTFALGMVAFTAASLLCGIAATPGQLVAARLLQGLAAAAMVPQVLSLITVTFPAEHRGRATAWYGAVSGIAALAGQILGGMLLASGLGWRMIFLVNVPFGLVAAALAARRLPAGSGRMARFDPIGAVTVSLTLAVVLVPLAVGREAGWPWWTWACLVAAAPIGLLAVRTQLGLARRGGEPIIDPRLFGNRRYLALLVASALFQLYFGALMFTLTMLLQGKLGNSPVTAALVFLPQGVLFTISSMLGGRLAARYGVRVLLSGGGMAMAGLVALAGTLAATDGQLPSWWLAPPLALVGLGNGFLLPPLIGAALAQVRPEQAGAASGAFTTTQQFANALGVTVLGTLFFALAGPRLVTADMATEVLCAVYVVLIAAALVLIGARGREGAA